MAKESLITPELQTMLPQAVKEVGALYFGDMIANILKNQTPEQRDEFWNETSQKFPPFSERINAFRRMLKNSYITKGAYSDRVIAVMKMHFNNVIKDEQAIELLTDVLFARIIKSPGYIDYDIKTIDEAEAMINELRDYLREKNPQQQNPETNEIDLNTVIEAILLGRLHLTRQTPLKK